MAHAIIDFNGSKRATMRLGFFGDNIGSVKQNTPDGDTINVAAQPTDDFGVRFLGIDTPEKRLPLPGGAPNTFISLDNPGWIDFLNDPFTNGSPFTQSLTAHIQSRIMNGDAAVNHHGHASTAEDELEAFVQADVDEYQNAGLIQNHTEFRFFLQFAFEILDGFGRFLAFINRSQPDANEPSARPTDYNTRMLEAGFASPYLIWPNVNPFRARGSILDAVLAPGTANDIATSDSKLADARMKVKQARADGRGIYDPTNPLRLEAFEVRFLSRQQSPSRWVIDLSKDDDILVHPQNYHSIPNAEDRLFINREHVPLFLQSGWVREQAPL